MTQTNKTTSDSSCQKPRLESWKFSLYVFSNTAKSARALRNAKRICQEQLGDRCTLEVIDLAIHPEFAKRDNIVAVPTLLRNVPAPRKQLIGDLSDTSKVIKGLDL